MQRKHWFLALLALLSVITYLDRNAISIAGIDQRIFYVNQQSYELKLLATG